MMLEDKFRQTIRGGGLTGSVKESSIRTCSTSHQSAALSRVDWTRVDETSIVHWRACCSSIWGTNNYSVCVERGGGENVRLLNDE